MGSSYRSDLNSGRMPEWEEKLRSAIALIQEVRERVWDVIGDDRQFDNAADDGGLAERLGIAIGFISGELPKRDTKEAQSSAGRDPVESQPEPLLHSKEGLDTETRG